MYDRWAYGVGSLWYMRRQLEGPPVSLSMWLLLPLISVATAASIAVQTTRDDLPPSCPSMTYCQGDLLRVVQLADPPLFNDSKTFVDMRLLNDYNTTLANFDKLMAQFGPDPPRDEVLRFVEANYVRGGELEPWDPPDWKPSPKFLSRVVDPTLRSFGENLHGLWKSLSRRVADEVRSKPDMFSMVYVPNGFIIPGCRFREYYYWDTIWIVEGLLVSDMPKTVKGMLENFIHLVTTLGHIPNGGRVYYEQRSQMPLLIPMFKMYVDYCKENGCYDIKFIADNIAMLEKEYEYWITNRVTNVTTSSGMYQVFRYYAPSLGPRPESYKEDYKASMAASDEKARQDYYTDFKSSAESGWDFSSRWFLSNDSNGGRLKDIHTQHILPVDLNAVICQNARILSDFYEVLGDTEKSQSLVKAAQKMQDVMYEVFWNEELGIWLDYDTINGVSRNYFFPSNLAPLWTGCFDKSKLDKYKLLNYFTEVDQYVGGIPSSLVPTGQQWDFPFAWPPHQSMIVQALQNVKDTKTDALAFSLAQKWVQANYKGYDKYDIMFEKYDATDPGEYGGGGEYMVQTGFGWTNGVILEFLNRYGSDLVAKNVTNQKDQYHHNYIRNSNARVVSSINHDGNKQVETLNKKVLHHFNCSLNL